MPTTTVERPAVRDRLLSIDFFRGIMMLLLAGEAAQVYQAMIGPEFTDTWLYVAGIQFHHVEWHGLRF